MVRTLVFILGLFLIASSIFAQADSSGCLSWLNIGGRFTPHDGLPYRNNFRHGGAQVSYNFGIGKMYGQVFASMQGQPRNSKDEYEHAILGIGAGQRYARRYLMMAVFAGPAIHWNRYISFRNPSASYAGFQLTQQIIFLPIPEIGIGLEFMQNFNAFHSFASYHFTISACNWK
ncbi:MAG TPA: hypothetical protein VHP30_03235 [Ignavibacteriales bacterium]|nr:hypothetical protein [Ignavibacteriales bacterium]